jgi:hypothetical protein
MAKKLRPFCLPSCVLLPAGRTFANPPCKAGFKELESPRLAPVSPTAVRDAVVMAQPTKRVRCRSSWHWLTGQLLEGNHDFRTAQSLIGHDELKTTITHAQICNRSSAKTCRHRNVPELEQGAPSALSYGNPDKNGGRHPQS